MRAHNQFAPNLYIAEEYALVGRVAREYGLGLGQQWRVGVERDRYALGIL